MMGPGDVGRHFSMDLSCFLWAETWLPLISHYLFNDLYMMNSLSWKIYLVLFSWRKSRLFFLECSLSTVIISPSEPKLRQAYFPTSEDSGSLCSMSPSHVHPLHVQVPSGRLFAALWEWELREPLWVLTPWLALLPWVIKSFVSHLGSCVLCYYSWN